MKETIQKALEGGWKPIGYGEFSDNAISYKIQAVMKIKYKERIFLDPLFWQSLGKSLGWSSYGEHHHESGEECNGFCIEDIKGTGWKSHWHRFIDHLIQGKDIDSFFTALLPDSTQ